MNQPVSHFPQVVKVQSSIEQLRELYQKYEKSSEQLDRIAKEAGCFSVRLPLVGAFSCGKTTLINALIGEKLFAVEVNPETALPVELTYAPTQEFIGYTAAGDARSMSHDEVLQQQFSDLLPDGCLQARLPADNLKQLAQLTLVDMPGWDSGIEQHSQAIDAYLHRSLAYCLVVSADEGNLRESLRLFIQELAVRKMPALVIITKTDKKPQSDIDAVEQQITAEVTKILGQPPLGVVQVAARKRQIQSFVDLLHTLQGQADERFFAAVTDPLLKDSLGLEKRLETLLNQDNMDAEALQVKRQELEQQMREFEAKINMETDALDAQVDSASGHIVRRVESALMAQVGSLASRAVNGGDLNGSIGSTLRLAISQGVQTEFAPKLKRYFERIEHEVPTALNVDVDLNLATLESKDIKFDVSQLLPVLGPILTTVLSRLALPALIGPIGIAVSLLIGLFSGGSSKSKEEQEREQLETAKSKIISEVIPQVKSQVELTLRDHLLAQAEDAKQQIIAATRAQSQQHQETLNQLEVELEKGKEAFEQKRQGYLKDMELLKSIQTELVA